LPAALAAFAAMTHLREHEAPIIRVTCMRAVIGTPRVITRMRERAGVEKARIRFRASAGAYGCAAGHHEGTDAKPDFGRPFHDHPVDAASPCRRKHCRTAMQVDRPRADAPRQDTSPSESPAEIKILELFQ